jgi:hypothetical protein
MSVEIMREEFRSIAASFGALIDGLSYVDEDLALKLANKFSTKLANVTREVYVEMAGEVAQELAKPRRNRKRRKVAPPEFSSTGLPPSSGYDYNTYFGNESQIPLEEGDEIIEESGSRSRPIVDGDFNNLLVSQEVTEGRRIPNTDLRRIAPQKRIP